MSTITTASGLQYIELSVGEGEVAKAVQIARVRDGIEAGGYNPGGESPEEFAKFIRSELNTLRDAVAAAKLTPQ